MNHPFGTYGISLQSKHTFLTKTLFSFVALLWLLKFLSQPYLLTFLCMIAHRMSKKCRMLLLSIPCHFVAGKNFHPKGRLVAQLLERKVFLLKCWCLFIWKQSGPIVLLSHQRGVQETIQSAKQEG